MYLVFLSDTSNNWAVSSLNTNLSITSLHYFDGLYASAGTLAPNSDRLLFSNDEGRTWMQKMEGLSQNSVYASSFITLDSTLMVGTTEGIYVRNNNSALWRSVYQQAISPMVSPWYVFKGTNNVCFANNYRTKELLRSDNKGSNWLQAQIPSDSLFDATSYGQMIFLATNKGIFVSSDGGQKFEAINSGLPIPSVSSIATLNDYIYVVSQGKVYRTKIVQTSVQEELLQDIFKVTIYPNPSSIRCDIAYYAEKPTQFLIEVYNSMGVKVGSWLKENAFQKQIHEINVETYPSGSYIANISANGKSQAIKFIVVR